MNISQRQALRFGRMYEDSQVEQDSFARCKRVFCIASGGCTLLALASTCEVVGCDVNRAQLAYVRRRLQGAGEQIGRTERALSVARSFAPVIGWRKSSLQRFLSFTDSKEQLQYWDKVLDTRRFRVLFDTVMGIRALTAKHLVQMRSLEFGPIVRQRLSRGFGTHPNATNPYMHAVLLGKKNQTPVPRQLQPIHLVHADAASYLESCAPGSFDGFTFSNIIDGTTTLYRRRLIESISRAGTSQATIVLRSFDQYPLDKSNDFTQNDRSLMWGTVFVGKQSDLTSLKGLL
jgi:S-adenosylmethionine:diacylglycerol 3-amino-3-carboxypropyl transferase